MKGKSLLSLALVLIGYCRADETSSVPVNPAVNDAKPFIQPFSFQIEDADTHESIPFTTVYWTERWQEASGSKPFYERSGFLFSGNTNVVCVSNLNSKVDNSFRFAGTGYEPLTLEYNGKDGRPSVGLYNTRQSPRPLTTYAATNGIITVPLHKWLRAFSSDGSTNDIRDNVFEPIVSAIAGEPLEQQYEFILRLSKGLMSESIARHGRRTNIPNFGDLAREIMVQHKYDLMRTILTRREIEPGDYLSIAELLAKDLDAATFHILLTNSDPATPDAPNDKGYLEGTNIITGDAGFPEFSCSVLGGYYLSSGRFHKQAEAQLIKILKHHIRTGVRAYAASRLGNCDDTEAIGALEEATKDSGLIIDSSGPFDHVNEYAEESLQKIKERKKIEPSTRQPDE